MTEKYNGICQGCEEPSDCILIDGAGWLCPNCIEELIESLRADITIEKQRAETAEAALGKSEEDTERTDWIGIDWID